MITISDKHNCCGCSACQQACPKQCISMHEDEEGFLYPRVDETLCIDCGLCEKVCPVINQEERRTPISCYAAVNSNMVIRKESSSGGVFTMLAENVIDDGGLVFGAAWDERWRVVHKYTETKEGLAAFRGSKYVQSVIGDTYKQAEHFLKAGRKVLFSGTPCQIAGLCKFLKKDYDNLITVDFICHGVPSPGVFRWNLQEEINNYVGHKDGNNADMFSPIHSIPKEDVLLPDGLRIEDISFRDKREGWKKFSFTLTLTEASADGKQNSVSLSRTLHEHPFLKGFLNNYYLRPSCHKCPSKQFKSGSDITLADYWGYRGDIIKDDDTGISAILVSSEKGLSAFLLIGCTCVEVPYNDILRVNGAAERSATAPYRAYFYQQKGKSLEQIVKKLTSTKISDKIIRKIWLMIHDKCYN